jgi:hypothetical protein
MTIIVICTLFWSADLGSGAVEEDVRQDSIPVDGNDLAVLSSLMCNASENHTTTTDTAAKDLHPLEGTGKKRALHISPVTSDLHKADFAAIPTTQKRPRGAIPLGWSVHTQLPDGCKPVEKQRALSLVVSANGSPVPSDSATEPQKNLTVFPEEYIQLQKMRVAVAARALIAQEFMEMLRCNNVALDETQMAKLVELLDLVAPLPILPNPQGICIYTFKRLIIASLTPVN